MTSSEMGLVTYLFFNRVWYATVQGKLVSKSEDSVRTELNVWGFHVVPKCGGGLPAPRKGSIMVDVIG